MLRVCVCVFLGSELMPNPSGGSVYKPKSRFHPKPAEDKTPKEEEKSIFPSNVKKPPVWPLD